MTLRSGPTRAALLFGALVALAIPAGCGRSDNPATSPQAPAVTQDTEDGDGGPATPPDACAVLPKADAEKLARTPLEDGVPGLASCTYTGPVTGPTAQVEVLLT